MSMSNTPSRKPRRQTTPRGFTLIDMLVTLSIIMLLVATLLPALVEVRRASKRAVCMTHQYEIGKFIERHSQANNGYFPSFQYSFDYDSQSLIVSTQPKGYHESGVDHFIDSQMTCPVDEQPGTISYFDQKSLLRIRSTSRKVRCVSAVINCW